MKSETVVLRRELHEVHAERDLCQDTMRCMASAIEALSLDLAEARAAVAAHEERHERQRREIDGMARKNRAMAGLLEQNGIACEAAVLAERGDTAEQQALAGAREELAAERAENNRVSNAHTPPAAGSAAQGRLASYRKRNKANYSPGETGSGRAAPRRGRGVNLLAMAFGGKGRGGKGRGGKGRGKSDTLEDIPVSEVCDHTTGTCPTCGADADTEEAVKDVIDVPEPVRATKRRHRTSRGRCANGHRIDTTPRGLTRGSVFGPNLMAAIVFMFFATLSLASIRDMLGTYGLESVSRTTIMNALSAAAAQKFAAPASRISRRLKDSRSLMADETPVRIGKNRGYAWAFIGEYGIAITVGRSRGQAVVDLHCPYFDIPIVTDGYVSHNKSRVRQRCWAHLLRDAELLAAIHGGGMEELHQRLQSIFHNAKRLPPDITDEELKGWIDGVTHIADTYAGPGYTFGGKLRNAAPDLFTFVRHPGLPPTNNMSERTLRRVVPHRKIRLMFRSAAGMQTYGTLMTCMMTWDAQGKDLMRKIHGAIMAN